MGEAASSAHDTTRTSLLGNRPLAEADPEIDELIKREEHRQRSGLELIASENFTSRAVLDCLGSCLTNKYSEGLPGARYYGGTEVVDSIENLARSRALKAYHLNPEDWGINVQPYSGSPANFAAYTALMRPHDRMMGLDLPSGGHLTHGYYAGSKRVSATSLYFESMPYQVNPQTGLLDYDQLEERALVYHPVVLVCGSSAYPREWNYERLREIANKVGAYLMCDMAHISGLVAAQEVASPFEWCDIVTSTTHKSLRGPRAGIVFFRKTQHPFPKSPDMKNIEERVNFAVFPMLQGGPHNHQIAAIATIMKEAITPHFKQYAVQVRANAKTLASALQAYGYKIMTDGTDNHIVLWNVRFSGITGSKMEKLFGEANITVNKNAVAGDTSPMNPGGIRLGTPALTTRGLTEQDFEKVAHFLHRGIQIGLEVQKTSGKKLVDFCAALPGREDLSVLRADVCAFISAFPMPG